MGIATQLGFPKILRSYTKHWQKSVFFRGAQISRNHGLAENGENAYAEFGYQRA